MNQRRVVGGLSGLLLIALLLPVVGRNCAMAQQRDGAPKSASDAPVKKTRAKPRGRLPAYFSAVVSADQRAQVYSIQSRYGQQIDELRRRISEMSKARDMEVEGVLTPEQLKRVNAKRAEAKARRAKRSKRPATTPAGA